LRRRLLRRDRQKKAETETTKKAGERHGRKGGGEVGMDTPEMGFVGGILGESEVGSRRSEVGSVGTSVIEWISEGERGGAGGEERGSSPALDPVGWGRGGENDTLKVEKSEAKRDERRESEP